MTVIDATQLDGSLCGLRQAHTSAAPLAEDALVGDLIVLRPAAEILGRNLLQPPPALGGNRMRRARHRMGGLAAARGAGPWQVLRRISPRDYDLFPWHAHHLRGHPVDIVYRFGAKIADAGLNIQLAVGFENKQPIEADCSARIATHRNTHAARHGSAALG